MSNAQSDLEDPQHLGRTPQPPADALTVSNKDLAPLLARAASVVPRNSAIPVLGYVMLQSSSASLTVLANNLEMAIRQSCPARGPERSVCVEAASLNALLRQLPGDASIRMEFGERHLTLKSGAVRAKLATLPTEDFPAFRDLTYAATFEIAGADLALALNRTRPFVSVDQSRYYLSGVHFRPVDGEIRLEGINGKCVGMAMLAGSAIPMIVPIRAVDEILKLVGDAPVQIRCSVVAIEVQTNGVTFMSKLIDATYPDLDRVLQNQVGTAAVDRVWRINRDAMLRAISTASAMGSAGSIGDFRLSESGSEIKVEERSEQLKRDDEITIALDDAACSFVGSDCQFRIRLNELTGIIKAAGPVCEFRPNAELSWFRINDVDDPRATFIVGSYR